MANTLIQLKHSLVTNIPPSLNTAEPAYSYTSNTLFIGLNGAVINIGGQFYTSQIDNATDQSTGSRIVKRDASGNATFNYVIGNLSGNASTADKLQTARDIGLAGDLTGNVSFDGSANITLTAELTNTGVTSGTYGGSANVPFFTVDEDGRITSAGNTAISTVLNVAADDASIGVDLLTETLTINGRDGITTSAVDSNNTILIDVDNTVIRTTGGQTIGGNLSITGNLNVTGNVISFGSENLIVNDPIIVLANNNTGNVLDIGFVGKYANGNEKELGLVHHAATDKFYLFTGYEGSVESTNVLNIADPTIVVANLVTNIIGGRVYDLTSAIEVADGGTGNTTFDSGQMIVGNGTGALQTIANTGTAGTYANASHVPVITTDAYGRVSSITNTAINISTDQVASGTLPIARGGTNNTTYTTGAMLQYDGTKIATLANTTYTLTGGLSSSNTITSLTVDAYGRVTAATGDAIAIAASQITSGTLGVARGGTGATTFTTNGVILGQGTNALSTVSSSTEGHVLTINASGAPEFQMLSGGTF